MGLHLGRGFDAEPRVKRSLEATVASYIIRYTYIYIYIGAEGL